MRPRNLRTDEKKHISFNQQSGDELFLQPFWSSSLELIYRGERERKENCVAVRVFCEIHSSAFNGSGVSEKWKLHELEKLNMSATFHMNDRCNYSFFASASHGTRKSTELRRNIHIMLSQLGRDWKLFTNFFNAQPVCLQVLNNCKLIELISCGKRWMCSNMIFRQKNNYIGTERVVVCARKKRHKLMYNRRLGMVGRILR